MLIVALVLVALVLGLNLVATVMIVQRQGLSFGMRAMQLLLVWLLPLVGAILCLVIATADGPGSRSDGGTAGSYDASGNHASDSHSHSHSSSDCSSDSGGGDGGSCGD
ncbi:hypothetical protein [Stenotrophomonas sp. 24(2023)]|uniref:hypothetical protein n=1 Tax=Stenotrophomonas sp. 24(2023) TaxID=3068324 RepID=UPI0027E1914D|nr:hypothetical protein [Stenotrophomonas sp. 24(2023)]WMJ68270.1 hypothetical protein Q9R17_13810 [Stenotrophomonas sp. 24(2023)]